MELLFCITATDRSGSAQNRTDISGPCSPAEAKILLEEFKKDKFMKSRYKYFKIAQYPFKEKK